MPNTDSGIVFDMIVSFARLKIIDGFVNGANSVFNFDHPYDTVTTESTSGQLIDDLREYFIRIHNDRP